MTQFSPDATFVLAHISDPHLTGLDSVRWTQLFGKRLSGYLSWQRRRRHVHRTDRLAHLVRDLKHQAPDHIVVTGDLTQIGTPQECREASRWLNELGNPDKVSVVPGNHDAYAPGHWDETLGLWREYMAGAQDPDDFPYRLDKGDIELIGLNTAEPTPLTRATGRLGNGQLDRLERMLNEPNPRERLRILLLHHPPFAVAMSRRKRLVDARRLREVLARRRADLILHGHTHRQREDWLPASHGRTAVIGVPSASAALDCETTGAAYNLIYIRRGPTGWDIQLERRQIQPDGSALISSRMSLNDR